MDACVHATAIANCAAFGIVDPASHRMPLYLDKTQFDSIPASDQLRGLRPDQLRSLELVQPFGSRQDGPVARAMTHFVNALEVIKIGPRLFVAWADEAKPEPDLPEGVSVVESQIDPAGVLDTTKRLATWKLDSPLQNQGFQGDPRVSFDPILNAPPWPSDPDDNLQARSNMLLVITKHLIEGMERSVNESHWKEVLSSLESLWPTTETKVWLPVQFDDREEENKVRAAVAGSHPELVAYRQEGSSLTYLRIENDRVVGRAIRPASKLRVGESHGAAVENATRAAAGRWGLPDFVLKPKVVRKGSGIREIGDGTIWSGQRGIALQVKGREVGTDTSDRAKSWLMKNAAAGLRQARGTIRTTLAGDDVTLTNLRGRAFNFTGSGVNWLPVVVLDHPNPPDGVTPAPDPKGPSVVILRRDWEFLWDQLRSATAVVEYMHRVATEEPLELGAETHRYFDLAERDANAAPNKVPRWMTALGARSMHLPTLPREPASAADEVGHAVFQRILEDVAETDFTGDESQRLHGLALIDRVAVAERASLGRVLLQRLGQCASVDRGEHRVEHRVMFIDKGSLHLTFTTMTQLTGYYQNLYQTWLLHRRQTFLLKGKAKGPDLPWTVGVLLTPRQDARRPWDTTVIATNSPPHFDDDEYKRLEPLLAPNMSGT